MAMEGVELEFSPRCPKGISQPGPSERHRGAGPCAVLLEKLMLDVMYDAPSNDDFLHVNITQQVVTGQAKPIIRRKEGRAAA